MPRFEVDSRHFLHGRTASKEGLTSRVKDIQISSLNQGLKMSFGKYCSENDTVSRSKTLSFNFFKGSSALLNKFVGNMGYAILNPYTGHMEGTFC